MVCSEMFSSFSFPLFSYHPTLPIQRKKKCTHIQKAKTKTQTFVGSKKKKKQKKWREEMLRRGKGPDSCISSKDLNIDF